MCKYAKTHIYAEAPEEQIQGNIIGGEKVKESKIEMKQIRKQMQDLKQETDETNKRGTNEERNSGARRNVHFLRPRQRRS